MIVSDGSKELKFPIPYTATTERHFAAALCPNGFFSCNNGDCIPRRLVVLCDGIWQCKDGSDEEECLKTMTRAVGNYEPPQSVASTIILPTIVACVVLVVSMLVGIKKCRKWELDRIVEMRRNRRAIQSQVAILKAKNLQRLRAVLNVKNVSAAGDNKLDASNGPGTVQAPAPPLYRSGSWSSSSAADGHSPPPSYHSSVLNRLLGELQGTDQTSDQFPRCVRDRQKRSSKTSSTYSWV